MLLGSGEIATTKHAIKHVTVGNHKSILGGEGGGGGGGEIKMGDGRSGPGSRSLVRGGQVRAGGLPWMAARA